MFIKIFHILDPEITASKCVSVYCLTSLELSNKSIIKEKLGNPNYLETKKYECSQPWGKEHIDMEIRKYFSLNMMKTQLAERN